MLPALLPLPQPLGPADSPTFNILTTAQSRLSGFNSGFFVYQSSGYYGLSFYTTQLFGLTFNKSSSYVHTISFANDGSTRTLNSGYFAWGNGAAPDPGLGGTTSLDLRLYRDGTGTLAQRNDTSPQEDRTARTYTDASNYAYLAASCRLVAGQYTLKPTELGTAVQSPAGPLAIEGTDAVGSNIVGGKTSLRGGAGTGSAAGGDVTFGISLPGSAGSSVNTITDILKLAAADGHLKWLADNAYDIGASGAKPRVIYAGTRVETVDLKATGNVDFSGLPTADPHVAGRAWSNAGIVTISAG